MKRVPLILALMAVIAAASSCSTTRILAENESLLRRNDVVIEGAGELSVTDVTPYIRQKPNGYLFGWNPFLCIYNWNNGTDKAGDRFCRKIGEEPVVFNPSLAASSESSIKSHLRYLGYYNSDVVSEVTLKNRKAKVKYVVTPGTRYVIDSIRFTVPEGGTFEQDFALDSSKISVRPGDFLSEASLSSESSRSVSALRNKGYFGLTKGAYNFIADTLTTPGRLILDYEISADDPTVFSKTRLRDVTISYPEGLHLRKKVLEGMNLLEPGQEYSETLVSDTYARFSSMKVFSTVGIEMTRVSEDKVDCDIALSQSMLQGFKVNLEVSTNSNGLMGVSPQLNYYHKNIFGGGEWLTVGLSGNFQFRFDDDTRATEAGISTGLSFPQLLGVGYRKYRGPNIPRTEIKASFNYQERPEYTRTIVSTSFGYSGSFSKRLYYQLYPFQLNFVRLFDLDENFAARLARNPFMQYTYQDHFDAGVGGNLYFTTSPTLIPKTSYWYSRFQFDLSGNILSLFKSAMPVNELGEHLIGGSPFSQYARTEVSLGRGLRFGKEDNQSIAFRFLAGVGYAYGNSTELPYEKQFYCGGSSSMRGWQARALGPSNLPPDPSFSIPSQTGNFKIEFDTEYRFPMFWKFEGAVFAEVGNIYKISDGIDLSTLAADWGIGIRCNLDVILLRLDAGIRLRDPANDVQWLNPVYAIGNGLAGLHFGVGYPF